MNEQLQRQIATFLATATKAREARPRERRESIQRLLVKRANGLRELKAEIEARVASGGRYLDEHQDADDFEAFEATWIDWCEDLSDIEEALGLGADLWLGSDALGEAA